MNDPSLKPNQENETTRIEVKLDGLSELPFVRTGVIGDGSCIFHAILSSYSNKYIRLSRNDKIAHVEQLRKMLPDMLTRDIWANLGKGEIARLGFMQTLVEMLETVYKHVMRDLHDEDTTRAHTDEEPVTIDEEVAAFIEDNFDVCKLFMMCVSLQDITDNVLGKLDERDVYFDAISFVKHVKRFFKSKFGKNLNEKDAAQFMLIVKKLVDFFTLLTQSCIVKAYEQYKHNLQTYSKWIGIEFVEFLSNTFSVNIYFIDGDTLQPYVFGQTGMFKHNKSIILIWIEKSHFEIVGLVEDDCVRRTFNSDEPIIQKIHTHSVGARTS